MILILIRQLHQAYRRIKGQALVEYAMIIMLVVITIMFALGILGEHTVSLYNSFLENFTNP